MYTSVNILVLSLCVFFVTTSAYEHSDIASAKIETCRGCSLNRLPEVKKFVMDDAPFYENIEVKFITGAPPELIFLDAGDNELERLALSGLNRQQCNELLQEKGFIKKSKKVDL